MDFKDAEKIEFEAMRVRHNRLLIYAAEKECDFGEVRAERIPSIEERKEEAKKAKKEAGNEQIKEEETKTISQKEYEAYQQYLEEKENNELQEVTEK